MDKERLKQLVLEEFERSHPKLLEDCLGAAARVSIAAYGVPPGDKEILWAATGLCRGLFGNETFNNAEEIQRIEWMDAAEMAIRNACYEVTA